MSKVHLSTNNLLVPNSLLLRKRGGITSAKVKKIFLVNYLYFVKMLSLLGVNQQTKKVLNFSILLGENSLFLKEFYSTIKHYRKTNSNFIFDHWAFFTKNKYYKGLRYLKSLPVRGQRTHTNSKTSRKLNGKI